VTEVTDQLNLNKATVHHHLSTLSEHGYLVNDSGRYRPSVRFFEVGQRVVQCKGVYESRVEPLRELAEEAGEVADLMIEEGGLGVCVAIEVGSNPITLDTSVGTTQYLHTCALGKAILAHSSKDRREEIYQYRGLPLDAEYYD